jgi:hypothetical protein
VRMKIYLLTYYPRFSHLINVEVIADLFDALKDILSAKGLGLNNKLQCIATAFQIIKRHGNTELVAFHLTVI